MKGAIAAHYWLVPGTQPLRQLGNTTLAHMPTAAALACGYVATSAAVPLEARTPWHLALDVMLFVLLHARSEYISRALNPGVDPKTSLPLIGLRPNPATPAKPVGFQTLMRNFWPAIPVVCYPLTEPSFAFLASFLATEVATSAYAWRQSCRAGHPPSLTVHRSAFDQAAKASARLLELPLTKLGPSPPLPWGELGSNAPLPWEELVGDHSQLPPERGELDLRGSEKDLERSIESAVCLASLAIPLLLSHAAAGEEAGDGVAVAAHLMQRTTLALGALRKRLPRDARLLFHEGQLCLGFASDLLRLGRAPQLRAALLRRGTFLFAASLALEPRCVRAQRSRVMAGVANTLLLQPGHECEAVPYARRAAESQPASAGGWAALFQLLADVRARQLNGTLPPQRRLLSQRPACSADEMDALAGRALARHRELTGRELAMNEHESGYQQFLLRLRTAKARSRLQGDRRGGARAGLQRAQRDASSGQDRAVAS